MKMVCLRAGVCLFTHGRACVVSILWPILVSRCLRVCEKRASLLKSNGIGFRRRAHKPLKTSFQAVDEALGGGLACPSVLEIVGASCSGKTEFLLNMCAENILPTEFEGVFVGGV